MSFFKKIAKGVKNIGKGIGKVFKGVGRLAKNIWNQPLLRTAIIGAAAFYTGGLAAGALTQAGAGTALATAGGSAAGAAASTAAGALGDAATGGEAFGNWKQDALTGALAGGVGGYGKAAAPTGPAPTGPAQPATPAQPGGMLKSAQISPELAGYTPSSAESLMGGAGAQPAAGGGLQAANTLPTAANVGAAPASSGLLGGAKAAWNSLGDYGQAAALQVGGSAISGYAQANAAGNVSEDQIREAKRQRISDLLTSGVPIYQAQIQADMEFNQLRRNSPPVGGWAPRGLA